MTRSQANDWHALLLHLAAKCDMRLVGTEERYRIIFAFWSFTKGEPVEYEIRYDLRNHELQCTCPDFTCRKARRFPTYADEGKLLCKHLRLFRDWYEECIRNAG